MHSLVIAECGEQRSISWNHGVVWLGGVLKSYLMLTPCHGGQEHLPLNQVAGYMAGKVFMPTGYLSKVFAVECVAFGRFQLSLLLPFFGKNPKDLRLHAGGIPHLPALAGASAAEGCRAGKTIQRAASSQGCFSLIFWPCFGLDNTFLQFHFHSVFCFFFFLLERFVLQTALKWQSSFGVTYAPGELLFALN